MHRLAQLIERRGPLIALFALALAIPAIWIASNLKVDQNFRRLLPTDAPEVKRLEATENVEAHLDAISECT